MFQLRIPFHVIFSFFLIYMILGNNSYEIVFSEHNVEVIFGRLFEYINTGSASPCPKVVHYLNRG